MLSKRFFTSIIKFDKMTEIKRLKESVVNFDDMYKMGDKSGIVSFKLEQKATYLKIYSNSYCAKNIVNCYNLKNITNNFLLENIEDDDNKYIYDLMNKLYLINKLSPTYITITNNTSNLFVPNLLVPSSYVKYHIYNSSNIITLNYYNLCKYLFEHYNFNFGYQTTNEIIEYDKNFYQLHEFILDEGTILYFHVQKKNNVFYYDHFSNDCDKLIENVILDKDKNILKKISDYFKTKYNLSNPEKKIFINIISVLTLILICPILHYKSYLN